MCRALLVGMANLLHSSVFRLEVNLLSVHNCRVVPSAPNATVIASWSNAPGSPLSVAQTHRVAHPGSYACNPAYYSHFSRPSQGPD